MLSNLITRHQPAASQTDSINMIRACKQHASYIQVPVGDSNVEDEEGATAALSSPFSPLSKLVCYTLMGSVLLMLATIAWWPASSNTTLSAATTIRADSEYQHEQKRQEEHQEKELISTFDTTDVHTYDYDTNINSSLFVELFTAESPYEEHWPGHHLPGWAEKRINFDIPRSQEICFTHVGKAGGSTLGCSLGFPLHCHDHIPSSSSLLVKLATHTFHKDVYNCHDDSGYFLFVIRDPIDRLRSAFNYERPDDQDFYNHEEWALRHSRFYSDCPFSRMEDLVQNGLRDEGDATKMCKFLALNAIQGTDTRAFGGPSHWYFNYQFYYEAIPRESKVIAIRNDHMEEDILSIEHLIGCNEEERLELAASMNVNTYSDQEDLYLSSESISILCQALCNEIQVYKRILSQALNISQDQIRESLRELEKKCPNQANAQECSDMMPDISEKLKENRGY